MLAKINTYDILEVRNINNLNIHNMHNVEYGDFLVYTRKVEDKKQSGIYVIKTDTSLSAYYCEYNIFKSALCVVDDEYIAIKDNNIIGYVVGMCRKL